MNKKQTKEDYIDLFKENLVDLLSLKEAYVLYELNLGLLEIFLEDKDFIKKIEKTIFQNQNKITSKEFSLEEKKLRPTVHNWLGYFIKENGSGMFDNICLSKFITYSDNAKKLDEEEREKLKNLLILYRNIRFFPKSQEDKGQEEWEVFPVNEERDVKNRIDDYKNKIKAIQNKKDDNKDNKQKKYIVEEMTNELKSMLEKYPKESLERKAIEEEIIKIRQKTN
jgi:hypothetical protein